MFLFNVLVYLIYLTKRGPGVFHVFSFKSLILFALGVLQTLWDTPKPPFSQYWMKPAFNLCNCFVHSLVFQLSLDGDFHSFLMKGFVKI